MKAAKKDAPRILRVVGHPVVRVDARAKVAGEATYAADFLEVQALQGKILRSPYAHAEIMRIDVSKAAALPGVRAVVSFYDAPAIAFEEGDDTLPEPVAPVYVLNRVLRHVGDEVAAVAADTIEIAEEALGKIEIDYRQLAFVLDAEAALAAGAPLVRGGATNLADNRLIFFERGDAGAGLKDADLILEGTYRTQSTSPLSLEPRYCVARWEGERLTVWKSSRHVHGDRNRLAKVFGLAHENARVVGLYMGAGFGSKDESRLAVITALAALKAGQPVRIGYTREEELAFGKWRHATVTRLKMGLKRDGSITAIDAKSVLNTGPYAPGFGVAQRLGHGLTYLYTSANARFEGKVAFTNAPVAGSYRGLGAPQAHFALESLADEAAERLGIDPLEFRKRNHVRSKGQPGSRRTPPDEIVPAQPIEGGIAFSSNYLAECLEEGARRIGWKPRPKGPRKLKVGSKCRGMGMAACIYKTGQSNSSAVVKVKADGMAEVFMSTMEIGQGAWTILIQIAAEALGLKFENVKGTFADTETTPFAHSTSGSTTTFTSGLAVLHAAEDAKRQICETAARLLEVRAEELELRDGLVLVKEDPGQHLPLGYIVARRENKVVMGQAALKAGSKTHIINSFAAHFAEVEVDPESGVIGVLRYVAVHDSGTIVNPVAAAGQIVGGVVQGLGFALMEDIPLDPESGAPIAMNLDTFKIPNLIDIPTIEPVVLNRPDPVGPYGAKALGEPPLVPVAAAIANAVYDATGVRIRELPLTAEKVLAGLRQQKE